MKEDPDTDWLMVAAVFIGAFLLGLLVGLWIV